MWPTGHNWNLSEVVDRRWIADTPLERTDLPWVLLAWLALTKDVGEPVDHEENLAGS